MEEKEAGEPVRAGPLRPDDLDLRRPCADDGRPGAPRELGTDSLSAGGGDGDQDLPASSASSWMKFTSFRVRKMKVKVSYLLTILSCGPRMICIVCTHTLGIATLISGVRFHEILEWFVAPALRYV